MTALGVQVVGEFFKVASKRIPSPFSVEEAKQSFIGAQMSRNTPRVCGVGRLLQDHYSHGAVPVGV